MICINIVAPQSQEGIHADSGFYAAFQFIKNDITRLLSVNRDGLLASVVCPLEQLSFEWICTNRKSLIENLRHSLAIGGLTQVEADQWRIAVYCSWEKIDAPGIDATNEEIEHFLFQAYAEGRALPGSFLPEDSTYDPPDPDRDIIRQRLKDIDEDMKIPQTNVWDADPSNWIEERCRFAWKYQDTRRFVRINDGRSKDWDASLYRK